MFDKSLKKREELLQIIGTSFNETFNNVVNSVSESIKKGNHLYFAGNGGGLMKEICNECFVVPSQHTTLIQEVHTILGHELCFNIEKRIFFND